MYKTMNINTHDDLYILCTIYPGFFSTYHKICENGEMFKFFICISHFLRFLKLKFLKANNTGKTFCVLKNLRCKSDHKKKEKIRSSRKS